MTNTVMTKPGMTALFAQNPTINDLAKINMGHPSASGKSGSWYLPLSPVDFQQRLALLADLQVPCMMYLPRAGIMRIVSGVIQPTDIDNTPFQLVNDDVRIALPRDNAHSIWLVSAGSNCPDGVVIEVYNRARNLVARLFSLPDKQIQAIWQDVLGNPSLAVA